MLEESQKTLYFKKLAKIMKINVLLITIYTRFHLFYSLFRAGFPKVGDTAPLGAFFEGQGRKLILSSTKNRQGGNFVDDFGKT